MKYIERAITPVLRKGMSESLAGRIAISELS